MQYVLVTRYIVVAYAYILHTDRQTDMHTCNAWAKSLFCQQPYDMCLYIYTCVHRKVAEAPSVRGTDSGRSVQHEVHSSASAPRPHLTELNPINPKNLSFCFSFKLHLGYDSGCGFLWGAVHLNFLPLAIPDGAPPNTPQLVFCSFLST